VNKERRKAKCMSVRSMGIVDCVFNMFTLSTCKISRLPISSYSHASVSSTTAASFVLLYHCSYLHMLKIPIGLFISIR